MSTTTQDTLRLISEAQKNAIHDDDVTRAFTQSSSATTGITFYDLEAPSKKLYPVLTPLRNRIARRVGGRGIQSNWKAVTGVNTTNMDFGVSEGNRGGVISQTVADYWAKFVGLGLENYTSFEADYAAEGFEDIKALAVQQLLQATMIKEEFCDLGGNGTLALGTTPTPTVATSTTGGTLAAATYNVYCVALTLQGYQQVAAVNNGTTGQSLALPTAALTASITRANADGTSDTYGGGVAQKSAAASQVTTGSTSTISASVTPVRGAVAYAWYWGVSGSELLGAVTTINSVLISATATGTQNISALPASDNSRNTLVYDGILTQIMKSGSGALFFDQATGTPGTGTKLTSDGAGGINEINNDLAAFWDQYRLSPDELYVGSQVLLDINAIIIKNGGAPLIRYTLDDGGATIDAGVVIGTILNKITNTKVKVVCHPNMPPGGILYWSNTIPYPLNDVGTIMLKHLRRDYYQIEWPRRSRKYEYGVYFDGVLKCYFPPAFGLRRNIAPGN